MQVNPSSPARAARRAQVVDAYLAVVADQGYDAATFARVAERAGLSSTRLISYHFADKDDLVAAAVGEVYARIGRAMQAGEAGKAGESGPDARGGLAAHVRAAVALNRVLPEEMAALADIFQRHRWPQAQATYDSRQEDAAVGRVLTILREGQASGTLRTDFDPVVVATTVQRAVDALPFTLRTRPDLDLDHWAEELVDLFDRATRA